MILADPVYRVPPKVTALEKFDISGIAADIFTKFT